MASLSSSTMRSLFSGKSLDCKLSTANSIRITKSDSRKNLIVKSQDPKYTGFVEKDTAGQTNIYAVEPTIYVAESAISTNAKGGSADGSGGTLIISTFLGVAAISGAAAVLFSVGSSQVEEVYSGPPLTYYIQKFSNSQVVETAPQIVTATFEIVVLDSPSTAPEVVDEIVEVPQAVAATEEVKEVESTPVVPEVESTAVAEAVQETTE